MGGTFKTFNTPLQESAALLGILANRGIKGSEAGTKLQSTLVNLTKKSGESYDAMQALGVSAYNANGDFKGITTVLEEVDAATANLTEEQRNNYLTMIAGKTQLTTLNALLSGLTNTLDNGENEFDSLYNKLGDCDGALNKMADTMTDNLSGALSLAQSATQDFQLEIGSKLEPYATKAVRWFSEQLPGATEKFGAWLDSKIPKAIDFCKNAFNKLKPVVSFIINNFEELAIAGAAVVAGLKAFSIAVRISTFVNKLSGVMKGLSTAQKLATVAQTAFNTSLLACPLTWIAAGIAAVAAGVLIWKKHLEKADIAKHFGDITLSAEECEEIVKGVFGADLLNQVDEVSSACEDFQSSLQNVSDSVKKLNKLNFQIQFGSDINEEDYMAAVDDYVANLQEAVKDKQYSLSLNIDLLFNNSEFGSSFSEDANGYYGQLSEQAAKLGEDLKAAAKNAYEHNWDLDSTEAVAAIMKQQAEIQEQISAAQSEAKLETLKYDFTTGDLSQESFQNLIEATNSELDNLRETYNNARIDTIAAAKLMYASGSDELATAIEEANSAYNEKIAGLTTKGLSFENEAIMGAFPEIADSIKEASNKVLNEVYSEEAFNDLADGTIPMTDSVVTAITQAMDMAFAEVPSETRGHILEFYEQMMPSVNELQNAMKGMDTVPKAYADVFAQSSAIGAVGNNSKALYNLGVTTLSTVLPEDVSKVLETSKTYGDSYVDGIENCKGDAVTAAEGLRTALTETLSKPLTASVSVTVNASTTDGFIGPVQGGSLSVPWLDSNATGTSYFGGGFTRVNENGGEIMDLPTGTRIIPSDKSEKLLTGTPNINVNVNINGNVIGNEEFADEVGDRVCEKVVDIVTAL